MRMRILRGLWAGAVVAALLGGVLSAQTAGTRPGVAELAVIPATLEIPPGGSARAAITVRLPEGFHMNSDKPRDENLIPITVSMEAVPAVSGLEAQAGRTARAPERTQAITRQAVEMRFMGGPRVGFWLRNGSRWRRRRRAW